MASLEAKLQTATGIFTKLQNGESLSLPLSLTSIPLTLFRPRLSRFALHRSPLRCADYARAVENRQRLDAQKTENEGVKKELSALAPTERVFKLVGPVMLKQEQAEARSNVDKRLEWIGGEIKRVEAQLKDFESKLEAKKLEIVHLQTQFQQQQQTAAQAGGAAAGAGVGPGGAPPVVQAA
ncbi:hypothetical protein JCM11251_005268 [Rhodosporidiobolus azoricus]